jgi:hypothetical protein
MGNELVDERAWQAALEGSIFERPLSPRNFKSLALPALLRAWQAKWDSADTGTFTHSIFPEGQKGGEKVCLHCVKCFIWILLCSFASYGRFRFVEDLMCLLWSHMLHDNNVWAVSCILCKLVSLSVYCYKIVAKDCTSFLYGYSISLVLIDLQYLTQKAMTQYIPDSIIWYVFSISHQHDHILLIY